jgi:hypothetical protein
MRLMKAGHMRSLRLLISVALVTSASAVSAEPYRAMDVSREAIQSIDDGSIVRSAGSVQVWLFTNYWQPQPFGKQRMSRAKSLIEFDCANNRMRFLAMHFFQDRDTPLPAGEDKITPWSAIIPDAWVMTARNAVCDGDYTPMGAIKWEDYEAMVSINLAIARQAFPSLR